MMMTAKQAARSIMIRARVVELRRLAERTAQAYREAEQRAKDREALDRTGDIDIPPRHRELGRMLLGMVEPPKPRKLLPPPRNEI
jgi:hypothetical protein